MVVCVIRGRSCKSVFVVVVGGGVWEFVGDTRGAASMVDIRKE